MRKVANADFVKNSFATRCRLRSTFRPSRRPRPQCDRLDDLQRALQHLRPHIDDERQRRVSEPRVRSVPHGHDEQRSWVSVASSIARCTAGSALAEPFVARTMGLIWHLLLLSKARAGAAAAHLASAELRCGFTAAASLPALQPR